MTRTGDSPAGMPFSNSPTHAGGKPFGGAVTQ